MGEDNKSWIGKIGGPILGGVTGLVNTAVEDMFAEKAHQRQLEFWKTQQEYNSPANQAMRLRSAGLNPYSEVSSVPAGELSSVPKAGQTPFNVGAILESMTNSAQIDYLQSKANESEANAGLIGEKKLTEVEYRNKIIQEATNYMQAYEIGLIQKEEYELKMDRLREAMDNGYNEYLIDYETFLSDEAIKLSQIDLNSALKDYYDASTDVKKQEKYEVYQRALLHKANRALAKSEYWLNYAQKNHLELGDRVTKAEFKEYLDTDTHRQILRNLAVASGLNEAHIGLVEKRMKEAEEDFLQNGMFGDKATWRHAFKFYTDALLEPIIAGAIGVATGGKLGKSPTVPTDVIEWNTNSTF